jgi:TonB-linked SusC/RagA family outer membrane protein
MRKAASLLSVLMLFCVLALAQTRTVTGTVRDAQGNPVPFATVTEAGNSKNAVQADASGNYTIKVGDNSRITFSAAGFTSTTVAAGSASSVVLSRSGAENLQEVVVTALGIRRKAEEIGYSTARVTPEQITNGKSFNLAQALSGKVSGLTINNTSAAVNASPRIVLRGLRSLTGTNTALIVLDGVQVPSSTINFINPNDVERIDIMKGGQAATLFGSEGVNGAVIITTKKGSSKPEISIQHSSNQEKVSYLPRTQNNFGNGSAYGSSRDENYHPSENQQFGPAYNGELRPLGRTLADGSTLLLPYSGDKDARMKFWNTGYTGQTDFSYRSGDANSSFFASYQNLKSDGVVYGDEYNRNSFRLNAGRTYGKASLSFDANYTFDHSDRTNTDFYFFALNTTTWAPVDQYRDWQNNKFADMSNYFNDYYNNPFWLKDNIRFETRNQIFNTNVKLTFKPISSIELTGRVAYNNINGNTTTRNNNYAFTGYSSSQAYSNYFNLNYDFALTGRGRFVARTPLAGGMGESQGNTQRIVGDLFGTYNKKFGDFDLKTILGGQATADQSKAISVSTNGIGVPGFFNFSNSSTGLFAGGNSQSERRKIGGFVDATFGYKGFAYLHGSFRKDYTSLFSGPEIGYDDPTFTTYGLDASVILSDAFPSMKTNWLDAVKLRASYNKNGNDNLGPYQLQQNFFNGTGFPYSGLSGVSVGGTLVSDDLSAEQVTSTDFGVEIGLFKGRLNLEASVYNQASDKQVLTVSPSAASGYQAYRLNAADVENKGYEIDAKAIAYRRKDLTVNLNANYSYNENMVKQLYGSDIKSYEFQSPDALASLNAEVGQMFPYLKTTVFERDPQGRIIVDSADGWPLRAPARVGQGTTLPKHQLGLGINVAFKGLTLIANGEYRAGNLVYHDIGGDMTFTGSGAMTTIYDREQFVWPNSVYKDFSGKYVSNTNIAVGNYQAIYQGYGDQGFSRGFAGIGEMYMSSGAFWKLRDVSLSYDLPASVMNKIRAIKGVTLTVWGRNLKTWLPDDNWYTDPEFSNTSGNSLGINTSLNTPPTRQLGGTIRLVF